MKELLELLSKNARVLFINANLSAAKSHKLEHEVDAVVYVHQEPGQQCTTFTVIKNRNGLLAEITV